MSCPIRDRLCSDFALNHLSLSCLHLATAYLLLQDKAIVPEGLCTTTFLSHSIPPDHLFLVTPPIISSHLISPDLTHYISNSLARLSPFVTISPTQTQPPPRSDPGAPNNTHGSTKQKKKYKQKEKKKETEKQAGRQAPSQAPPPEC